ncbi:MAG: hypothetical protein ACJ8DW_04890, partial [Microvirga sp.]
GGIARLSRAQRRQTFQTLALSEASDSYDSDSYDDDLGECREADAVTSVSGDTLGAEGPSVRKSTLRNRISPG